MREGVQNGSQGIVSRVKADGSKTLAGFWVSIGVAVVSERFAGIANFHFAGETPKVFLLSSFLRA